MKLSVKLPSDILGTLTPTPAPSGTSMSSKTPGRDFFSKYVVSISNYLGDDMTLHAFTKFSSLAKIYLAHCESKLL